LADSLSARVDTDALLRTGENKVKWRKFLQQKHDEQAQGDGADERNIGGGEGT
jgi:hypothetical protein